MIKKLTIFIVAALLILPIGYVGAQWLWCRFHHRYDTPQTGLYRGSVFAWFDSFDGPLYYLRFRAETSPRWYWRQPTNFSYTSIEVNWWRGEPAERPATVSLPEFTDQSGDVTGLATISLPEFTYRSGDGSGAFTRDVLASWLFGSTNRVAHARQVDAIFRYFEAAARGTLPRPRHHTYNLRQPVTVSFTHWLLGHGVGSTVYIWLVVWLLSVVLISRKILRTGVD